MILHLKGYAGQRVNAEGRVEDFFITYLGSNDSWRYKTVNLFFTNYASPAESERKIKMIANGGQATMIREQESFSLHCSPADYWQEALKPVISGRDKQADYQALTSGEMSFEEFEAIYHPTTIENQSNKYWELAKDFAFIPDFSLIDETNARVEVLKSLNELNAQEIIFEIDSDSLQ